MATVKSPVRANSHVSTPIAMAKRKLSENKIEITCPAPPDLRAYCNHLATHPDLFSYGLSLEFCSFSLYAFLEARPWETDKNWKWSFPENWYTKVYSKVPGQKSTMTTYGRDDWIKFNLQIVEWGNRPPEAMLEELFRIGKEKAKKKSSRDNGKFTVIYSFLVWATTVLFPKEKYFRPVELPTITSAQGAS